MLRIVLALLLVVGCCGSLSAAGHPSQPDTLVITREMLAKGVLFDTLRVRFHAGDDIRWKEPNFDDSAWQVVRNDTSAKNLHNSIGWFRVSIRLQDALPTTVATFNASILFGAEEIYLDGNHLYSSGIPSAVPEREEIGLQYRSFSFLPFILHHGTTHTFAIRVSAWEREKANQNYVFQLLQFVNNQQFGFRIHVMSFASAGELKDKDYSAELLYTTILSILVTILFVTIGLAIFDPQDVQARYLCVYVLGCVFIVIARKLYYTIEGTSPYLDTIGGSLFFLGFMLKSTFMLLSISRLIFKQIFLLHIFFPIFTCAIYLVSTATNGRGSILDITASVLYLLIYIEALRLLIVGVLRSKTDTNLWILMTGIFAVISVELYESVMILVNISQTRHESFLSYLALYVLYTAIPISLLFVFVRRTLQDRQHLARYSQDLERDVAERTRDLQTANEEISRQMEVQAEQAREIEKAHHESESLLLNILPAPIAHRLKSGERAIADKFNAVTVLFADIVGFTKLSAQTTPEELVQGLNGIFERFDALAKKYNLEKIKTIGDAYMVAGGLPERSSDHCERVAMFALEIQAVMQEESLRTSTGEPVRLRVGIHTGEAVAGVIGTSKFAYDLWGDTVNTASRMESHGEAGKIHVSDEVYQRLKEQFVFEERGEIDIKGKGVMRTWFLTGIAQPAPYTPLT